MPRPVDFLGLCCLVREHLPGLDPGKLTYDNLVAAVKRIHDRLEAQRLAGMSEEAKKREAFVKAVQAARAARGDPVTEEEEARGYREPDPFEQMAAAWQAVRR